MPPRVFAGVLCTAVAADVAPASGDPDVGVFGFESPPPQPTRAIAAAPAPTATEPPSILRLVMRADSILSQYLPAMSRPPPRSRPPGRTCTACVRYAAA